MFTCKDKSTIDYFLSTPNLFGIFTNLKVLEFNPLFSDVHCPVSVSIGITDTKLSCEVKKKTTVEEKINLWDSEKSNIFVQNFDSKALSEIGDRLSALANKDTIKQEDIEFIVDVIGKLFSDTAEISFGKKRILNDRKTKNKTQWFNAECRRARNQYHYARKLYNKQKSEHNKQFFRTVSKTYKLQYYNTLEKKEDRIKKIKTLKHSNFKEYWKYLKSDTEKPSCAYK